jgi:hypothetical protein
MPAIDRPRRKNIKPAAEADVPLWMKQQLEAECDEDTDDDPSYAPGRAVDSSTEGDDDDDQEGGTGEDDDDDEDDENEEAEEEE